MNIKQAKSESLVNFIEKLGGKVTHIRGHDVWFRSPFRPNEKTPSFKVDAQKNIWYDHGLGKGGTIIDFVGELHEITDVSRILSMIAEVLGRSSPESFTQIREVIVKPKQSPVIESVSEVVDASLLAYIASRGIPVDLARLYLKEVVYRLEENTFRALGFGNDSSGYEVRSPRFKGVLGKKDITSFVRPKSASVGVFEGFFDFLSILTHYGRDQASGNVVVLNSINQIPRFVEKMNGWNIENVFTYFDHDTAGDEGLRRLQSVANLTVVNQSGLYSGFKDANDWLIARKNQRQMFLENDDLPPPHLNR